MMKYLFLFALLTLIGSGIFAQTNQIPSSDNVEKELSVETQTLEKIAENKVSSTTKVFTYKVFDKPIFYAQDNQSPALLNKSQQKIVDYFLSIKGVSMASYDKATNCYTVVTNNSTKISSNLKFD